MTRNIYINDKALDEPYLATKQITSGMIDTTIPPGYFFVMGDNRADSIDSRFQEVGFISFKDIIGKMLIKIFWNEHRISTLRGYRASLYYYGYK